MKNELMCRENLTYNQFYSTLTGLIINGTELSFKGSILDLKYQI